MNNKLWGYIPGEESWAGDNDAAFQPLPKTPVSSDLSRKVRKFIETRIQEIMSWYCNCPMSGDPIVDCPETRRNINSDLDAIFPEAEEKFGLKKIPRVLRVRSGDRPGFLVVRSESTSLL